MKARSKVIWASAALGVLTFPNITPAHAAAGVPFTNSIVDRVIGGGSDTTHTLVNQLATAYNQSDGCVLNTASFPLTPTSPIQNRCQSGTGAALLGDNTFENYDHDTVFTYYPQGSNVGRGQLCAQSQPRDAKVPPLDFARSSSAPGVGFACQASTYNHDGITGTGVLRFIGFARDALSWTRWDTGTGASDPVANLTTAQLNDIFVDCTITDWSQVGGGSGAITVYTAIPGSGSRSSWDAFIGGNTSTCIPAPFKDGSITNGERVIREHQMEPVEVALNDPGAVDEGNSIFFMSTGIHAADAGARANSLIGQVNGVTATEATVVGGTFPFGRDMYNVIRQSGLAPVASGATRRFTGYLNPTATNQQSVGWICKGEAHHSEQVGNPNPVGNEQPTATQDWFEIKQAAFEATGFYQLAPEPVAGHRCNFTDVAVPQP